MTRRFLTACVKCLTGKRISAGLKGSLRHVEGILLFFRMAAVVLARNPCDLCRQLVPGTSGRQGEYLVWWLLRLAAKGSFQRGRRFPWWSLWLYLHLLTYRRNLHRCGCALGLLHQALDIPVAAGNERLLHEALAAAATDWRGKSEGTGRYSSLCHYGWRHWCVHASICLDTCCLPTNPFGAICSNSWASFDRRSFKRHGHSTEISTV